MNVYYWTNTATEVIAGEKLILTAGGIDTHVSRFVVVLNQRI